MKKTLGSVAICLLLLAIFVGCGCNILTVNPDEIVLVHEGEVASVIVGTGFSPFQDTVIFSSGYMVSEMHLFVLDNNYNVVSAYNINDYHYLYKYRAGTYYFLTQEELPQEDMEVKL